MSLTPPQVAAELRRLADIVETFTATEPPPTSVVFLPPGGDVTAALQRLAETGGAVELEAGGDYQGPVQAPTRRAGAPLLTLRTRGLLPDRRLTPDDAPLLASLHAANADGALRFEETSNYCVDGLRLVIDGPVPEAVIIQDSAQITLARLLVEATLKRVIRGNGRDITVARCHLDGGAWTGQDSQAFCAWEGAGPYTLIDNTLMASGENVMFGGSDNYQHEGADNPADIHIEANWLYKPLAWKSVPGSVKNLLELKNATRVVIRGNRFENNWTDAQSGWSILFTPMNQDGRAPWTVVKDVLFERNYLTGLERGINMKGRSYTHVTQQASGIVVRQNVIETAGQFMQADAEIADLTIEDNVSDNGYNTGVLPEADIRDVEDQPTRHTLTSVVQLRWNRNVHRDNGYGIHSEVGIGTAALEARTQTYEFLTNRFQGLHYTYPPTTTGITEAEFQAAKAALLHEIGFS